MSYVIGLFSPTVLSYFISFTINIIILVIVINHETKARFMFDIDYMHTVALLNLSEIDSNLVIE